MSPFLAVSRIDIAAWIASALLAVGVGWGRYAKWKTRDKLIRDLAHMDPERRARFLSSLNPKLAGEVRQQLMERFRIMT